MIAKRKGCVLLFVASIFVAVELSPVLGLHSNEKYDYLSKKLNEYLDKYEPLEKETISRSLIRTRSRDSSVRNDPDAGHERLSKAVAKLYSKLTQRDLDANEDVLITVGATEALQLTFQTFTEPADEWIVFEPFYWPFESMIQEAGGVPRYVLMRPESEEGFGDPANWTFDRRAMESLFNKKTRGIVLNTPHNPTGKMFSYEDLIFIADLAKKWNAIVLSDEVYEFITFDNRRHLKISTLPDMFDRTVTVNSATKILGALGNRVGWAIAGGKLLNAMRPLHNEIVKRTPVNNQEAVAIALEKETENFGKPYSYVEVSKRTIQKSRNLLIRILGEIGAKTITPEGGHHLMAYIKCNVPQNYRSCQLLMWLLARKDIDGLPLVDFFEKDNQHLGKDGFRLTMMKEEMAIEEVAETFLRWKNERHQ